MLHVHRVVPGRLGGTYTPDNVALLCPNCHAVAHDLSRDGSNATLDDVRRWNAKALKQLRRGVAGSLESVFRRHYATAAERSQHRLARASAEKAFREMAEQQGVDPLVLAVSLLDKA